MYKFLRPLLFRLDPERAHQLTLNALRAANYEPLNWFVSQIFKPPSKPVEAFGLKFKNPVGLAAGYDKDAVAMRGLAALGFGHIEVGTVTPLPQDGNPKPRIFRLVEDEAVINRLGFPGRGSEFVQGRLNPSLNPNWLERFIGFGPRRKKTFKRILNDVILGVNIGKNKSTSNEEAVLDYLALLQNFAPSADYLTINVSSPNTIGLRQLQGRNALDALLTQLHAQRQLEEKRLDKKLPLLVKLAPDLSETELDDALSVILQTRMDGVIVTNTTLAREGLRRRPELVEGSSHQNESGGLSGSPLRARSEAILKKVAKRVNGQIPIVSVGGIMNPDDAKRRLDMGATLIQIYTGLIYRGPGLVNAIVRSL
ncbi:MAG: quinone-dependent dihydroorotate dehydrogenase [Chloroflexi bacterium]|nr:quinone-dependent dihydroorotate dehydrogenase [Chloroflexota bacterium]